jgi:hypothetical protein
MAGPVLAVLPVCAKRQGSTTQSLQFSAWDECWKGLGSWCMRTMIRMISTYIIHHGRKRRRRIRKRRRKRTTMIVMIIYI